jgi:peptidoglycan hydrolase-like protein with peptidoglycan-binding domain
VAAVGVKRASRGVSRRLWPFFLIPVVLIVAAGSAVVELSGATLSSDPTALARLKVQAFGGKLESTQATGPDGQVIPLTLQHGLLTPQRKVAQGERINVDVTLKRPGWDAWLIGKTHHERLTVVAPTSTVTSKWVNGQPVKVDFSAPAANVAYHLSSSGKAKHAAPGKSAAITTATPAGQLRIAVAARSWEKLGPMTTVHYFPASKHTVALVSPAPGSKIGPAQVLKLTFSSPVKNALGSATPKLTPSVTGKWKHVNSHTLEFLPSGYGVPAGSTIKVELPKALSVADSHGNNAKTLHELAWTVPPPSPVRLQQLLAQAGYLPLTFKESGARVERTARGEADAEVIAPKGHFSWRYSNTPGELRKLWNEGEDNVIQKGAIMMFQNEHGLDVDGVAGPDVWKALMADAIAGKRHKGPYNYVYVHRNVPQKLTLWSAGHTVLTSPGNTGVPAAPTDLGTFPVFEHLRVTTMSGTNPDGSHYNDPGIPYVSYFNGGDALHAFPRASFGTPQSLGCVELPLAAAAKVWPYTPIGTLVTIEN